MIKNIKWLSLVALTVMACNNDDEVVADQPVTAGSADFSKYVALGDSFAAGYADGALFIKGQENSYPNLLASQFAQVGGGAFVQPLMNDNLGGFSMAGSQIPQFPRRLYFNGVAPTMVGGVSSTDITTHLTGSFGNMGIPGAKSFHLVAAGYGSSLGNPYFARFSSAPSTTVLADAMAQNPTFFSLWIGGNDVLGYAMSGGTGVNQNAVGGSTNPATYGSNDITNAAVFDNAVSTLAAQLSNNGTRKGVMANLPNVNTLPFFTTVGYNPVPLNAAQVSALNSGYAAYNGGLAVAFANNLITAEEKAARTINFVEGKNAVVIVDEYLTNLSGLGLPSYRQTTSADFVVLSSGGVSAQSHLAAGNGTQFPLADKWVLSKKEVEEIATATSAYNTSISNAATANNLALMDAATVMAQLQAGIRFGNFTMNAGYVSGGAFSLDGVHPTARGQALIANKFLEAINAKYGSTFKTLDLATFPFHYPASL